MKQRFPSLNSLFLISSQWKTFYLWYIATVDTEENGREKKWRKRAQPPKWMKAVTSIVNHDMGQLEKENKLYLIWKPFLSLFCFFRQRRVSCLSFYKIIFPPTPHSADDMDLGTVLSFSVNFFLISSPYLNLEWLKKKNRVCRFSFTIVYASVSGWGMTHPLDKMFSFLKTFLSM